jgi:PilZ domain
MSDCVPLPFPGSMGTIEQRRSERVYCQRSVQLRTSDQREFSGVCTDVNQSGIGIESKRVLAVGQRLELILAGQKRVPMLVIYRMADHYGLSALGSFEALLELLPKQ